MDSGYQSDSQNFRTRFRREFPVFCTRYSFIFKGTVTQDLRLEGFSKTSSPCHCLQSEEEEKNSNYDHITPRWHLFYVWSVFDRQPIDVKFKYLQFTLRWHSIQYISENLKFYIKLATVPLTGLDRKPEILCYSNNNYTSWWLWYRDVLTQRCC